MRNFFIVFATWIGIALFSFPSFALGPVNHTDDNGISLINRQTPRSVILEGKARAASRLQRADESPTLVRDYDVFYYRIDLTVDDVAETIQGDVVMAARSRLDGLTAIDIDFYDNMAIDSIMGFGQTIGFTRSNDVITANLSAPIDDGNVFFIRVFYSGTPTNEGFFGSFAFDSHQGEPIIWSLSQPDFSRTWWPCNDDPSDKADSVDIFLTVSDELVATSQGRLESETDNGDGTKTFYWKERYPISSYLVSVAISNYQSYTDWYVPDVGDSMPITYYVYPEDFARAQNSFDNVVPMMELFSDLFGEYPFLTEKYAHSAVPFPGGMEHQTNTSYGSMLITGDHTFDWLAAHELAHMWWGDMVTCEPGKMSG